MIRGGKFLLVGGCLAAAACVQTQSVKVRAIADPAAKVRFSGGLLGEARAQLALGDVGIALETFRTLSRQQPNNPDAYAGIAACYAAMGRYDIARQNYEFALAYAPTDPALLTALASSLERLGEADQAAEVRLEAARLQAPAVAPVSVAQTTVTPLAVPRLTSVTVKVPEPSPAPAPPKRSAPLMAAEQAPAIAAPQLTPPAVKLSSAPLAPKKTEMAANVTIAVPAPPEGKEAPAPEIAAPQLTMSAKIRLASAPLAPKKTELASNEPISIPVPTEALLTPSPEIAAPHLTAPKVKLSSAPFGPGTIQLASNVELPTFVPKDVTRAPAAPVQRPQVAADKPRETVIAQAERPIEGGPRLERLSAGEVSLVTTPVPVRMAHSSPRLPEPPLPGRTDIAMNAAPARPETRLANASALRWVPLKYAPAQGSIQLLNAARTESLAARTRVALLDRGWHRIRIGNARKVRQHSLVLYASARWAVARRLAAHFGCRAVRADSVQNIVVLLGRDATMTKRGSSRA